MALFRALLLAASAAALAAAGVAGFWLWLRRGLPLERAARRTWRRARTAAANRGRRSPRWTAGRGGWT